MVKSTTDAMAKPKTRRKKDIEYLREIEELERRFEETKRLNAEAIERADRLLRRLRETRVYG